MMERLKIDDSVPIEAGLVDRIIEQSQSRVEGSNFDVRKHLLEYDDVLNTQRNRIYDQRDRVFVKEDLSDDFLEMVTAEVNRRVDLAETEGGEGGRWKLFAWLEEAQPSLPTGADSIYPSYLVEILLRSLEDKPDKPAALRELATTALETERAFLLDTVAKQVDAAEERLESQIKTKRAEGELALEGLENEAEEKAAEVDGRAAYKLLAEVLAVNLNPSAADLKEFDYDSFKKQIPTWAEAAVSGRVRAGLIGSIERRIGTTLDVPREFKGDEDWDDIRQQLVDATEKSHAAKAERSLAEIERELSHNLPAKPTRDDLARALISMAFGTVTAFDNKTHRKVALRTQRLNYFLAAGDLVGDWAAADLKQDVISHLGAALKALRRIWGEAEYRRLGGLKVAEMVPALRASLEADPVVAAALPAADTLNDVTGPAREGVEDDPGPIHGHAASAADHAPGDRQPMGGIPDLGRGAAHRHRPGGLCPARPAGGLQEQSVRNVHGAVEQHPLRHRGARLHLPAAPGQRGPARPRRRSARHSRARQRRPPGPGRPAARGRQHGPQRAMLVRLGKKYKDCHYARDHAAGAAEPVDQAGAPAVAAVAAAPANSESSGSKRRRRRR